MKRGKTFTEIEITEAEKEFLKNLKSNLDEFNSILQYEKVERNTREEVHKIIAKISNILRNGLVEVDEWKENYKICPL